MVKKKNKSECTTTIVLKGAWTAEEDRILTEYVKTHGEKNWKSLPSEAGLSRCGKSCRLRWLNYLRPGIKRGNISEDEEDLIYRLHNLIGNRWALIAKRLPGRTDNEIKNHWNTHLSKKSFTISELNMKLSKKQESDADHSSAFSTKGPTSSPASDINWARTSHPDIKSEGFGDSELPSDPLSGLAEKDLSNDKHLGLYWASGLQGSGPHVTNRLVGNNPNCHKGETSQDCFNGKLQGSKSGCLDQQKMHNQLDFDTLARLMEYQDDLFYYFSQG